MDTATVFSPKTSALIVFIAIASQFHHLNSFKNEFLIFTTVHKKILKNICNLESERRSKCRTTEYLPGVGRLVRKQDQIFRESALLLFFVLF